LSRILIIGSSCSGKSTLGDRLSQKTAIEHIEIDDLYWKPGWQHVSDSELRTEIQEVSAKESWIISGNYSQVREILWPRATDLIWLNLSFPLVLSRAVSRTVRRLISRKLVCNGNTESLGSLLSYEGIPFWVIRTHRKYQSSYRELIESQTFPNLQVHELRDVVEIDRFLNNLELAF